jgi:hypothetical protein
VVPGVVVGARWSGGEAVMPWCRVRLRCPDDTDTLLGVWLRRMGKERLVSQAAMLRTGQEECEDEIVIDGERRAARVGVKEGNEGPFNGLARGSRYERNGALIRQSFA